MISAEYDEKYSRALLAGARSSGSTEIEFCLQQRILFSAYRKWVKTIPDFKAAAEWGDMQCAAYWQKLYRDTCEAEKAPASQIQYAMKNIPLINWVDKKEEFAEPEEPPREIRITVLPPRKTEKDNASDL